MNYNQATGYVNEAKNRGIVPGLDNMYMLCSRLGYPNKAVKTLHIAGTNGKGSVGTFLTCILEEAGYSVGRYVSPAVFDYREIIQLNGKMISEDDFARCMTLVRSAADTLPAENRPTAFELETAAAFVFFKISGCDYAVVECGMGGRLDATNVTDKVMAVFTSISIDHSAFLGDTIEKIAYEKAGIIKNCPVVSAKQPDCVERILREKADDIKFVSNEDIKNVRYSCTKTVFDYGGIENVETGLCGKFQTENAAVAIDAAKKMGIDCDCIKKGIKKAVWKGRFSIVCTNPFLIIDGAHNIDAAIRLKESLAIYAKDKPLYFVMGMLRDKEYAKVAAELVPLAECIYTITPQNGRGLSGKKLAECAGQRAVFTGSVEKAISAALKDARLCGGAVVVFGSLSFLKEAYDCVGKEMHRELLWKE